VRLLADTKGITVLRHLDADPVYGPPSSVLGLPHRFVVNAQHT